MSDSKISELDDGGTLQAGDLFVVARAGENVSIDESEIVGSGFQLIGSSTDTTDPGDFTVLPLIDCEGPGIIYMKSTLLSFVEDGETVGPVDPTDIYFDVSNFTAGRHSNALATPVWWLTDWRGWDVNTFMSEVGQWIGITMPTERYVQPWLQVFQNASVYAGSNNPTGTFLTEAYKLDVTVT